MCQGWTLNPPSCLARSVRSNSPHAWWSCPRGRMWAKRCGRKSIKLLGCPPRTTELVLLLRGRTIYFGWFVLCSVSLHNCAWKCSRCFVVQQVWSSEKCNFQKLDICVFLSLTISSAKTVSSPCFRKQTDRHTDRCVPHNRRRMSFVSELVLIQHDRSPCFTLLCCLKFSLVLRYISNSLRWNCLWVGIPNQNGGFYFSECLRGNYINPNRNHIGVWNDKWRPWITALLLLYLGTGKKRKNSFHCAATF